MPSAAWLLLCCRVPMTGNWGRRSHAPASNLQQTRAKARVMSQIVRKAALVLLALVLALVLTLALLRIAAAVRETTGSTPPTTKLIATPYGRVAVAVRGPAHGPPVLLVHGTVAWSGFWREVAAHLANRGWRVVAVDLPPFGYSDRDPQARYDRTHQAARLSAVLRAVGSGPAVVVGHSFGAGAATELALRHPRQLRSLVLVDAALGKLDPTAADASTAASALRNPFLAQTVTSASVTNPLATGPLLRSLMARKDAAEPWLDTLRQPMRRSGTTAGHAAWLPALFTADDGALSRKSRNLAGIAVPVSIIWGIADTVTPIAQGERIAALTRARSFARLPGVGHVPHIEEPAGFLAALDAAIAADVTLEAVRGRGPK